MVIPLAGVVENLQRTVGIDSKLDISISSDKVQCAYQIGSPVNGATEPGSGNCKKCLKDKEHNSECLGFRGVVLLEAGLVMRLANSPTVYCPLYDNDVKINGACHHTLGNCKFCKGVILSEIGKGVLCEYRVGKK